MFGLYCDWRPIAMRSAWPFSRMASACRASRMMPTAIVAISASLRTRSAKGPWKPSAGGPLRRGCRPGNATRGAIDHVDAARFQFAGKDHGVVHVPALLGAVDRGDPHEQR